MVSFRLYREFGALNSPPIFDALQSGILATGNKIVSSNEDISVIWSVLWNGRMAENWPIYQKAKAENRPIMIIEVGNLLRGTTWRLGLGNINRRGYFGNEENLDNNRPSKLNLGLYEKNNDRRSEILIAGQHEMSLQWEGQPSPIKWIRRTIEEIRKHSDRPIIFRPHPRSRISINYKELGISVEIPKKIINTYDSFDLKFNYHCVINHNSGPAIHAGINGTPVICDPSSLAFPISGKIQEIEKIDLPDRHDWFVKLCHTEWTVEEISKGIPLIRLMPEIERQLIG